MEKKINLNIPATEQFETRHKNEFSEIGKFADGFNKVANDCASLLEKHLGDQIDDDLEMTEQMEPMINDMTKYITAMKRRVGILKAALEEEDPDLDVDDSFVDKYTALIRDAESICSDLVDIYDGLTIDFPDEDDDFDDADWDDDENEDIDDPVFAVRYYGNGNFQVDCQDPCNLGSQRCENAMSELIALLS